MGKWLDRMVADPTSWLLEKACPSIRYRLLTEIHGRPAEDPDVTEIRQEVYAYKPPHTISTAQSDDGTWFTSLDGFENLNLNRKRGPGTLCQYLALLEYGWGTDHPIVWRTSELLQGFMWEDPSLDLCELKGYCGGDPAVESYLRKMLSQKALGLLARSGFEEDVGVKRKGAELIKALDAFYQGDVHDKIYVGEHIRQKDTDDGPVDEHCAIISPDAFRPDYSMMLFFGWNAPLRDDPLAQSVLDRVVDAMFAHEHPEFEVLEVGGKIFERDPEFAIRNLDRDQFAEGKLLGRLLQELELLARVGRLERVPKAVELLEWVLSLQDEEGVVRGEDYVEKVYNRLDYPWFPLEDNWRGRHKKFTDITFRLYLILAILDG